MEIIHCEWWDPPLVNLGFEIYDPPSWVGLWRHGKSSFFIINVDRRRRLVDGPCVVLNELSFGLTFASQFLILTENEIIFNFLQTQMPI